MRCDRVTLILDMQKFANFLRLSTRQHLSRLLKLVNSMLENQFLFWRLRTTTLCPAGNSKSAAGKTAAAAKGGKNNAKVTVIYLALTTCCFTC